MKEFKPILIQDEFSAFSKWEDVRDLPLSAITKRTDDVKKLDGLILKGYEMKFANGTNGNGERYEVNCAVDFLKDYFVKNNLNMVVDIEHDPRPEWLSGRVIYFECNNTGLYPIVYIPRVCEMFNAIKWRLEEGILQGFSKCGWCTDGEWKEDKNGGYWLVKKIEIVRMSVVSTPANAIGFEKVAEIKNTLIVEDKTKDKKSAFAAMFNH